MTDKGYRNLSLEITIYVGLIFLQIVIGKGWIAFGIFAVGVISLLARILADLEFICECLQKGK